MDTATIQTAFDIIMESDIFRTDGDSIDLTQCVLDLADAVNSTDTDEHIWAMGEGLDCDLSSLIIGAFWVFTEWHAGQCSDSYRALCQLGTIYTPNMANGPEPESSEQTAYDMLSAYMESTQ